MLEIFKKIVEADPLHNKQNVQWLTKLFTNNLLKLEDLYKATEYLTLYEKVKQAKRIPIERRDINYFNSLPELYEVIAPFEKIEIKSKSEEEREKKLEGADRIYEDSHWLVITPKNEEAACLYGAETQWCTASKGNNYFQRYHKDGPLYILIDKTIKSDPRKNPNKKLQFHFETGQFMDAQDHSIKIGDFFRNNKQLLALFIKLGRANAPFRLENRLMEKNEVMKFLRDPRERVKFLDNGKFGGEWIFNYLSELGETEEIKKIIFEDELFLTKLLEKSNLPMLEYGLKKLKGLSKNEFAEFLYNNKTILNFFSKHPQTDKDISEYLKMMKRAGKQGEEYAKNMFIKTDTLYDILKKHKQLVDYYNIFQDKKIFTNGAKEALLKLNDKKLKYTNDYLQLFPLYSLQILKGFLKDVQSEKPKKKSLEESFSIGTFKNQFTKDGIEYLKNIGFSS